MQIEIPFNFTPRSYQLELLKALDNGFKRALAVYHRRAGKDKTLFNVIIKKSLERKGVYYYLFPEFAQGRRVIWEGMDASGYRFLDHIPKPLIKRMNSTDMKIELVNGSIIQIIGTDKFDKVRGSNPVGCVFSEFAFQNPVAWDVIRPILAENGGWAVFNSSTNGKNHFYKMYQMALNDPAWFVQNITVDDSRDAQGKRYVPEEAVEAERRAGMPEEMIQQEFYNSFTANAQGYYYLSEIELAEKEGRITKVPYNPSYPVDCYFDIGYTDNCVIWFVQRINRVFHIIDLYHDKGQKFSHYAKELQKKPYVYSSMNFPHDMKKTEFGTGRSNYEVAEELFKGMEVNVVQKLDVQDGINAVRMIFPICYFDAEKCKDGLEALQNYHREYDRERKEFKQKPVHDWSSDFADAFRYFATGITMPREIHRTDAYLKGYRRLSSRNWQLS